MKISSPDDPSHAKDSFLNHYADAKHNKDARFTSRRSVDLKSSIAEDVMIDFSRGSHEVKEKQSEFSNKEERELFVNRLRRISSKEAIGRHYNSLPSSFWAPALLSPTDDEEVKIDIVDDISAL
mmetsp:Transcript_23073/g.38624  ORF Transcript_23073/g.38624 Transcript_23073/m.38624 type:complete len:124 (+) Transcript_23073:1098-1469(+)